MCSELFKCDDFTIYALNSKVEEFFCDLSPRDWVKFDSVVKLFTQLLLTGAPAVDRVAKVAGTANKLYELKITPPGSKGPQLRVLCIVRGLKIVCVRAIDKRQPRLRSQDIKAADRAAGEYQRDEDERKGKGTKRREDPP